MTDARNRLVASSILPTDGSVVQPSQITTFTNAIPSGTEVIFDIPVAFNGPVILTDKDNVRFTHLPGINIQQTSRGAPYIQREGGTNFVSTGGIFTHAADRVTSAAAPPNSTDNTIPYNSAFLSLYGDGFEVHDAQFVNFLAWVGVWGDYRDTTDKSILAKNIVIDKLSGTDFSFGAIVTRVDGLVMKDCEGRSGSDYGTGNPGHLLYLTDRSGHFSMNLTVTGNRCIDSDWEAFKFRKGDGIILTDNLLDNCGRGVLVEFGNNITVANNVMKNMTQRAADSRPGLINLSNAVHALVHDNQCHISLGDWKSFGVGGEFDQHSQDVTFRDNVIYYDKYSDGRNLLPNDSYSYETYQVSDCTDVTFERELIVNYGDSNGGFRAYGVRGNAQNVRIIDPRQFAPNVTTNINRMVQLFGTSTSDQDGDGGSETIPA